MKKGTTNNPNGRPPIPLEELQARLDKAHGPGRLDVLRCRYNGLSQPMIVYCRKCQLWFRQVPLSLARGSSPRCGCPRPDNTIVPTWELEDWQNACSRNSEY